MLADTSKSNISWSNLLWEQQDLTIDVDDLRGILDQLYAISEGWGMGFTSVLEEPKTYCTLTYG